MAKKSEIIDSAVANKSVIESKKIAGKYNQRLLKAFNATRSIDNNAFIDEIITSTEVAVSSINKLLFDTEVAGFIEGGVSGKVAPFLKTVAKKSKSDFFDPPPTSSLIYPNGAPQPSIRFPIIDNAGKILQESQVMQPDVFNGLAAEARQSAFTISGKLEDDTISKVKDILTENIQNVTNRTEFMARVREEIPKLPLSEAHLEQVFRNNTNAAYSDGQEKVLQNPIVGSAFPYRAYFAIRDSRARPEHLRLEKMGLSGTNVYYHLDPVWQIFRPPWDWNCRCGFIAFTKRQAARAGVQEAIKWLDTGVEPVHEFVARPDFLPSPSWVRVEGGVAV